jgi:hypothetical protein
VLVFQKQKSSCSIAFPDLGKDLDYDFSLGFITDPGSSNQHPEKGVGLCLRVFIGIRQKNKPNCGEGFYFLA